jgi:alpha-1,6-mannosyltransferase
MRIVHVASFYGPPSENFTTALRHLGAGYHRAGHEFFLIGPGLTSRRTTSSYGTHIEVPTVRSVAGRRSLVPAGFAVRDLLTELSPDRLELSDRLTRPFVTQWADEHRTPIVLFGPDSSDPHKATVDPRPPRMTAIAPGVDLAEFSPLRWSLQARHDHSEGADVLLVHVGGLGRRGAPSLSITALETLRGRGVNARLVLLGNGELGGRLARDIESLPVTVPGRIDDPRQLAILLANADVALSPGRGRDGIAGLAALEALAAGTPVVATVGSDAARLIADGPGELTAATGTAFADAIQRVLARRVDERRSEARSHAARFPWRTTVNSLLDLHEFPGLLEPEYQPIH